MRQIAFTFSIILALSIESVGHVKAEEKMVVDMGKLTCGELNKLGFQDFAGLTLPLSLRPCRSE
jgi:acid stress chaperone HdeB